MSSQSLRVAYIHSEELVETANTLPANVGRHRLAHELIRAHGLLELPDEAAEGDKVKDGGRARAYVVEPLAATREQLIKFHDERFVDTLLGLDTAPESNSDSDSSTSDSSSPVKLTPASFRLVSEEDRPAKRRKVDHMGLEDDCPMFSELSEYVQLVAGASIQGARELRDGKADVAIAWTGGRHHGKRGEAAGFCYVQDVVLAILELRLMPPPPSRSPSPSSTNSRSSPVPSPPPIQAPPPIRRVLYLDIDLHHGDGVESAFYSSPHTLTLSVHLHAPLFYPSTGSLSSTGPTPPKGSSKSSPAAHHALNLALHPGLSTPTLLRLFESCIQPIYEIYQPDAVVLQCGCDGLAGDPCKEWNLDLAGMGEVVRRVVQGWGKRTLLLGGGGYDNANAARCWTYLTSVALNRPLALDNPIPPSLEPDDYARFAPSFTLDVPAGHKPDLNTDTKLVDVEEAFNRYAEALEEKYGKRKALEPGGDGG